MRGGLQRVSVGPVVFGRVFPKSDSVSCVCVRLDMSDSDPSSTAAVREWQSGNKFIFSARRCSNFEGPLLVCITRTTTKY